MPNPPWWNALRPGSFRGVAFFTRESSFESGRRGSVLEMPLQNDPVTQDVGRATQRYNVEAYLIGPEYNVAKVELIEALEKGGPGKLVHRYFGSFNAEVEPGRNFTVVESDSEGGYARFSIPFVRVPETQPVPIQIDTTTITGNVADKAKNFSIASFTKKFLVDGPEFIRDHALSVINRGINEVQAVNNQVTGALGASNQVNQAIKSFAGSAAQLIATPGMLYDLAKGGFGLHEAIMTSVGASAYAHKRNIQVLVDDIRDPKQVARDESRKIATITSLALNLGSQTAASAPALTGVGGASPGSRTAQMAQNQLAIQNLYQQSSVIETARAITDISFESNLAALAMRDQIAEALLVQAEKCEDDDVFGALQDLRVEISRHLVKEAGEAPRQRDFTPLTTLPVLLLAHLAHGDIRRAEEMVSRNGIRNPGFVLGGRPIKVVEAV